MRSTTSRATVVIPRTAVEPGLGRVATDHAFVERDAREPQRRRRRVHGGRDGLRLVERPDPGPAAAHPDVDEDRQGAPPPRQPARHPLDAGDRVDEDQQLRATGVEDAADPVEPGLVDDLVRDEDPLDPRVGGHLGLPRMGDGDRPGAGIDLPAEDRRRHGRLAVGRERDPAVATEVGEDRDVVGQRRLPEHEDGQADGRVEERATEPGVRGRAGHRRRHRQPPRRRLRRRTGPAVAASASAVGSGAGGSSGSAVWETRPARMIRCSSSTTRGSVSGCR